MLFNSFLFLIFFLLVYLIYHSVKQSYRKYVLYFSSIIFYGSWDIINFDSVLPKFLIHFLLAISINYIFILFIRKSEGSRRLIFFATIITLNLLNLGFFKYFYFATEIFGIIIGSADLKKEMMEKFPIILPIAISFYTFQIIAFVVDEYKNKIPPTTSYLDFSIFILFFPQQLAGPILRASDFLPQLNKQTELTDEKITDGISLIGLGLIKKVILADSMAFLLDPVFANPSAYQGKALLCAMFGFFFQLWGDFSGYSDIARGCGKLLGFDLAKNFTGPIFSQSFKEMWSRWHITLSSFLRDYVYFSLGGNRGSAFRTEFNGMITMLIAGIWHGAGWNFVLWGLLVGGSLSLERLVLDKFAFWKDSQTLFARIFRFIILGLFFSVLSFIFRIRGLSDIPIFMAKLNIFNSGQKILYENFFYLSILFYILQYLEFNPDFIKNKIQKPVRWILPISVVLLFAVSSLSNRQVQFFYFQF